MTLKEDNCSCEMPAKLDSKSNSNEHRYPAWMFLVAYTFFLIGRAWLRHNGAILHMPLWELQNSHRLLEWIGIWIFMGFYEFANFIPVGLFGWLVASTRRRPRYSLLMCLLILAYGGLFALLLQAIELGWLRYRVDTIGLVLPLLGCLMGIWIGVTWRRGRKARVWLLPKIALAAFVFIVCIGGVLWLSVEATPLPFDAARVTSEEKRRLVHLIRSKSPKSLIEGQSQTLKLTEHDIDVLLSWGLSLGSPNRKAKVSFGPESASLLGSIGLPLGSKKIRYLNLTVVGNMKMEGGSLRLDMERFRLGATETPKWLLKMVSPMAVSIINRARIFRPFLNATQEVVIEPDLFSVTYGYLDLPPRFREDLFGSEGMNEEILVSTRVQIENLLALVSLSPDVRPEFATCVETVFTFARDRSVTRDPVAENRAGIFALGMLLGHPRVEEFLGAVHAGRGHYAARRQLSRVDLRGRFDWTKHFWVSAAIAILSDEVVSNAAGVLKEELDSGKGGSGFSFSDLLADQAGTTFAMRAIRDEAAARAMQNRLAGGFRIDDFFPPAADLPEDIADAELQSRYGGVGGAGYNLIIEEIEERIAACDAYR